LLKKTTIKTFLN